jgi:hypothetical protein
VRKKTTAVQYPGWDHRDPQAPGFEAAP